MSLHVTWTCGCSPLPRAAKSLQRVSCAQRDCPSNIFESSSTRGSRAQGHLVGGASTLQHGIHSGGNAPVGVGRFPAENLKVHLILLNNATQLTENFILTSRTTVGNANTSLATVGLASRRPHRQGSISSGASAASDGLSKFLPGIADGREPS